MVCLLKRRKCYIPVQPLLVWLAESGSGHYSYVTECLPWPEGRGWTACQAVEECHLLCQTQRGKVWLLLAILPWRLHGELDPSPLPPEPAEPLWACSITMVLCWDDACQAVGQHQPQTFSGTLNVFRINSIISPVRLGVHDCIYL